MNKNIEILTKAKVGIMYGYICDTRPHILRKSEIEALGPEVVRAAKKLGLYDKA